MTAPVAREIKFGWRPAMSHKHFFLDEVVWHLVPWITEHLKYRDIEWTMDCHYHKRQRLCKDTQRHCPCCHARKGGLPHWACELCGIAWILSTTSMRMLNVVLCIGVGQPRCWIKWTPAEREERKAKRARTTGEWSGHGGQPARSSTWQPARPSPWGAALAALGHFGEREMDSDDMDPFGMDDDGKHKGYKPQAGKYTHALRSDPSWEQIGNDGNNDGNIRRSVPSRFHSASEQLPVSHSHSLPNRMRCHHDQVMALAYELMHCEVLS